MEKKLETRMMTENVMSREDKEKKDKEKELSQNIIGQSIFGRFCNYDENGTQTFNPNRG